MKLKYRLIIKNGLSTIQCKKRGIFNIFSDWIDCEKKDLDILDQVIIEIITNKMCH